MDMPLSPEEGFRSELSVEEQEKFDKLTMLIDAADIHTITRYGIGVQGKVSELTGKLLSEVEADHAGHIGKTLSGLLSQLRDIQADRLFDENKALAEYQPTGRSLRETVEDLTGRYQAASTRIVKLADILDKTQKALLKHTATLDGFYDAAVNYYQEINLYILAGEMKHRLIRDAVIPELESRAGLSNGGADARQHRDTALFSDRMARRIDGLTACREAAVRAGLQILIIRKNNRELAEKIRISILNLIPLWKIRIILVLSLLRRTTATNLRDKVPEAAGTHLKNDAGMRKERETDDWQAAAGGTDDLITLGNVNAELIDAVEETLKLHDQTDARRKQAEEEIGRLDRELGTGLAEERAQDGGQDLPLQHPSHRGINGPDPHGGEPCVD